jgi:hypothetical protein
MDAALALRAPVYAPPSVGLGGELTERDEVVWWAVFVGFAYVVAVAWATYCRWSGGYPEISLTWKGFKVVCKSEP